MHRLPIGAARGLRLGLALGVALAVGGSGCGPRRSGPAGSSCTWVAGCVEPAFDPAGPPHAVRWAIERLLSHGLFVEDSSGRATPSAGVSVERSSDGLTWTFRIAPGVRFADGARCTSREFRVGLERGLARTDHGTPAWLLGALQGADRLRAGRPLPRLGIETPDDATLVLRLRRPDPRLPEKLALPGVGVPWRETGRGGGWDAVGLGPYRVVRQDSTRRLVLARGAGASSGPDTVVIRFVAGSGRALAFLRAGVPDLLWPVPPGINRASLPAAYRPLLRVAQPPRRLVLVMRGDLPPTSQLPARAALAQALNYDELLHALGERVRAPGPWLAGAPPFAVPSLDREAVLRWMELAHLGRSFHVRMAYDADGIAAAAARVMQGQWARLGIYVELEPLRGEALARQMLTGNAHLLLAEDQPLLAGPEAALAGWILPLRGPAIGSFRTGWRTRDFDAWLDPRRASPPADPELVGRRLDDERMLVPIADLPWFWIERTELPAAFHPRFGPECSGVRRPAAAAR